MVPERYNRELLHIGDCARIHPTLLTRLSNLVRNCWEQFIEVSSFMSHCKNPSSGWTSPLFNTVLITFSNCT